MKIKLMAGEMARLHGISKQTLIYYDNIGLFKPLEIDNETGYRYYNLEQSEDLDVILCLKNLGMKLKEIKGFLQQRDTEERIRLLERQDSLIREKIEEIERVKHRLESIIASIKTRVNIRPFDLGIRWIDKRHIVSEPVEPPYGQYALELAIKKLLKNTRQRHDTGIHEMLVYVDSSTTAGNDRFSKVALQVRAQSGESIAAGYYGYIYHKGTYQTLEASRKKLKKHIEASGYRILGPAIEKILLDALAVSSESEHLVDIQIPVEKR